MSSASYAAWAKFDVEKELERVDELEQREEQQKQQRKQLQAKESVETSATQAAQQSADILSAQAAVAALKAKKRVRKGRREDAKDSVEADKAEKLQTQASLFNQKHELLQQILENRRLGDRADNKQAKPLFEKALASIKKLEELAPELLKAEQEQVKLLNKEPLKTNQSDKSHDCKHGTRKTTHDSEHKNGKDSLERVKIRLLTQGDAADAELNAVALSYVETDNDTIKRAVSDLTEGRTFKEMLERIQWTFEEANVLAVENFFDYSTTKYQVVLGCLEILRARPEFSSTNEDQISPVLRELKISCHLNIASGCLEMQRNYTKGLHHCEQALQHDNNQVITHFRMGQLHHALHNYEKALACFETAKTLVPVAKDSQACEQILSRISKEIDKCEFDRNQYDMVYLRVLSTK
ncbi:Serine/threonine-protein kinase Sgk3 [Phytophthora nicotianae]|uniref:peptidylprolyl isomerase n=1 Tax=Phytophthora nicotianae TaxID=4792 RepID=A0A0W8DU14_PHYNI|nr:Serine/threonine-protein kinase Sgk3 [Phytophthora nicotianae]